MTLFTSKYFINIMKTIFFSAENVSDKNLKMFINVRTVSVLMHDCFAAMFDIRLYGCFKDEFYNHDIWFCSTLSGLLSEKENEVARIGTSRFPR